jgi:hypothetical protein
MKKILLGAIVLFTACRKDGIESQQQQVNQKPKVIAEKSEIITSGQGENSFREKIIHIKVLTSLVKKFTSTQQDPPVLIWLDFSGGTLPADNLWSGDVELPYPNSGLQQGEINTILKEVAEDFYPFNAIVTLSKTQFNAARPDRRLWCAISRNLETIITGFSGVALQNSFGKLDSKSPNCFVMVDKAVGPNGIVRSIAGTISHELGHTVNLNHHRHTEDGDTYAYHPGFGTGLTSWVPNMGNPKVKNVLTWYSTTLQSDVDTLKIKLGAKPDEPSFQSLSMNIAKRAILDYDSKKSVSDLDWYELNRKEGEADPKRIWVTSLGNVDISIRIYDQNMTVIGTYDNLNSLSVNWILPEHIGKNAKYALVLPGFKDTHMPQSAKTGSYLITFRNI